MQRNRSHIIEFETKIASDFSYSFNMIRTNLINAQGAFKHLKPNSQFIGINSLETNESLVADGGRWLVRLDGQPFAIKVIV